jgi:hypothetical protein
MLTFTELKAVLQGSAAKKSQIGITTNKNAASKPIEGGFKEQERKIRRSTESDRPDSAKKQGVAIQIEKKMAKKTMTTTTTTTTTTKISAPLRCLDMEETPGNRSDEEGTGKSNQQTGKERPPPFIITTTVNHMKFQVEIKAISKRSFELCNTKIVATVTAREMADYSTLKHHLETKKIPFFTYHSKSSLPSQYPCRRCCQ